MSGAEIKPKTGPEAPTTSTLMVQITTDKTGPKFLCSLCDKTLLSLNGYLKHMQRHEPPGGFCCNYCEDRFCLDELLKKHKDEKHKVLGCQICYATFVTAQEYRTHIKDIHKGVDRQMSVCEKCGVEFKTPQAAKRHADTQCGLIKPYACDECPLAFYTKYNLNEHKKIHKGEKKFCCSYCGKSFLSNGRLMIHERSHTGEKPYKCDVCGKCFAHRESIVTHTSIHTGIRLVACKCCGARFSCHSNLIKHRRARQDTCGLPIYDSNGTKRSRKSRIPPGLVSSEIKIVQATRVINPDVKQTNPKASKGNILKPKLVQSNSDEEEVITKRPRQKQEKEEPVQNDVEIMKDMLNEPNDGYESDYNYDDPPFESPMDDYDSCSNENDDVKPEYLDRVMTVTPVKIEEEQTPNEVNIFNEKDQILDDLLTIKDEPLPEVKEELSETMKEDYRSIKPCRVILQKASLNYPLTHSSPSSKDEGSKRKLKRKRTAVRKKLSFFKKDRLYNCKFCVKIYQIRKPYEKHLQMQHDKTDEEIREMFKDEDNDIPSGLVHRCPICSRIYLMEKRLEAHIANHGPDGKLIHKCPCYCIIYFRTKEEAMEHAKTSHKKLLYCEICNKYSQSPESLKNHKRNHFQRRKQMDRNFICDKCAKSFPNRTSLNDHIRSNCGKNPLYQCEVCNKRFSTYGILKTHALLHKDETPYVCDKCGKAFKIKPQYMAHLKYRHSDDKPFKCELCPKQYPYRESLLTHMAVHTGLKRFACSGCSKRFTCISNLQSHRKVYADTCGLQPLNSKPSQYIGVQKGLLLMGTKPTF